MNNKYITVLFMTVLLFLTVNKVQSEIYPDYLNIQHQRSFNPANLTVQPGESMTVSVEIVYNESNPANGLYFSENFHRNISVETVSMMINGNSVGNIVQETGYEGAVYNAHVPYYWILEAPPDFNESNVVSQGDVVELTYTIMSNTDGSYQINKDGVFGLIQEDDIAFFSYDSESRSFVVGTGVGVTPDGTPVQSFDLVSAYPNPFNSTVKISVQLKQSYNMKILIFNAKGRLVKSLYNGLLNRGRHIISWGGTNNKNIIVSSGVYFCQLSGNSNLRRVVKLVYSR